jgi:hypothetical protein
MKKNQNMAKQKHTKKEEETRENKMGNLDVNLGVYFKLFS